MDIKKTVNPEDYSVGVIVARFQTHELHDPHKEMIDIVCDNHKKVLIFLGISTIPNTKRNPLDFATRMVMIQEYAPKAVIIPIKDNRSNLVWSKYLDSQISLIFGDANVKPLLYGSRDSFIPFYEGRFDTAELTSDVMISGTEIRNNVSKEILMSQDFRAGVIHANYAQRAVLYPTVDVVAYNDKGQILMAKKPNEDKYRFVGGFVDTSDNRLEHSARREFMEETGGSGEIGELKYVCSQAIDDWRYKKEDSGIMTTLFIGYFRWGYVRPSDDISELKWMDFSRFLDMGYIKHNMMPEHETLMITLVNKIKDGTLGIKTLEEQNTEKL